MNNPEVETAVETSETAPLMGDDVETREINAENRPTNGIISFIYLFIFK